MNKRKEEEDMEKDLRKEIRRMIRSLVVSLSVFFVVNLLCHSVVPKDMGENEKDECRENDNIYSLSMIEYTQASIKDFLGEDRLRELIS